MKKRQFNRKSGFTLAEIMITVAIIGLLVALAIPAYSQARKNSYACTCRQNRRIIFEALNIYCMDHGSELNPTKFPDLCASRDTLAPGGSAEYVKNWKIFECPVTDAQAEHDYAYVWDSGELMDIRCNNSNGTIRDLHNEQ